MTTVKKISNIAKTPRKKAVRQSKLTEISPEERHRMIAEAAYYMAKGRNFEMGDQASDWFMAELKIDAYINNIKRQNKRVAI